MKLKQKIKLGCISLKQNNNNNIYRSDFTPNSLVFIVCVCDAKRLRFFTACFPFHKEQRLHHVVMLLRGLFELFCQYGKYLWDQNPLMILVRRHQRLAFVQNYEEVMIQPRFGEKVLGILMSGEWSESDEVSLMPVI